MDVNELQQAAEKWIDENQPRWSAWCAQIFDFAETAWREYRSSAFYVELLTKEGFEVEVGSAGMPTAFCARWTNGDKSHGDGGPILGGYVEYDAIPGNCQAPVPHPQPRDGLSRFAPGHTDPHSALGVGALIGFLALKAVMTENNIAGSIKLFGEPAEKVCGSKPFHAAKGYYDELDAAFSFHPAYMLPLSNTCRWNIHCGGNYGKVYTFLCDDPRGWNEDAKAPIPLAHATARAPGATDALMTMYQLSKTTRDSMLSHTGFWSLNEAILIGGQATADNLPPSISQIAYACRAPKIDMLEKVFSVLDRNARLSAEAAFCRVVETWVSKTRPGLANLAFADLTYKNIERIGGPVMGDEAKSFARDIQSSLGVDPMDEPFMAEVSETISPEAAEAEIRQMLPPDFDNFTNDDYVEYTWHTPTVRFYIGRPMLKAPAAGYTYPDWAMNALGGYPATIDPMTAVAGKVIATTALDLLMDPQTLDAIKAEFKERTGGGIGGTSWKAPLLEADAQPPVDIRWPEYVSTPQGENHWWIGKQAENIETPA